MVNYSCALGLAIATILCSTVDAIAIRQELPAAASLQCYPTTDCSGPAAGTYSYNPNSNSLGNCYDASDCQCMVVTELHNANFQYWTGGAGTTEASCTGGSSSISIRCGIVISSETSNVTLSSKGTNSVSFNVGCPSRRA